MMGFNKLSPMQLTSLTIAGGVAAGTVYLFLPIRPDAHLSALWITLGIAIFIAGISLALKAPGDLKNGIAAQRWPETQIESLRSILDSPAVTVLALVFFIAYASIVFLHGRFRHIAWSFYMPLMSLNLLCNACKEPQSQAPPERLNWNSIQPLQSEHWGEK